MVSYISSMRNNFWNFLFDFIFHCLIETSYLDIERFKISLQLYDFNNLIKAFFINLTGLTY